ncbi:kinase-like domain-containing protein [Suillus subluteus]|nr:kinase-like domain-containing protein [Suillus subluteus]
MEISTSVYTTDQRAMQMFVAVKAIRQQFFSAEIFRRELGIWKRLRHSNILKFMGTTSDFGPSVALVAPWMTNGTLTSFLDQNNETLELHDRLLLLRDIAAGLNYLHTFSLTEGGHTDLNPIVHGDLTGTNVLIDNDRKAYLADFGLSGTFKKSTGMTYLAKMTCHPGAVRWAAPELLSGEEPASAATTQSDMYSFGNIMLQVLTGNVPWCHLTRDLQIMYQVAIEGKIHPRPHDVYVTDRHWNFMTCCWSMPFTDRPPAKDAVQFVNSALHLSTSPQSPTSSISSDERHPGIARNDYLQGDADARLPVMQVIDSPLDARENDPRVQWKGSFTFTIQHAGQPKGFEVQVAAVNSKGQLHTETWPDRMILDISQKGLKDPSELKLWLQKHRQSVVMVQFEPQARDSEQKMNDMVYVIIMTKMETRTFGIAAWQLPSGPISYNMIVFPMNNVLVGAVFPVTGLPDLPGSSKVDAPKPQPQPQPHPQGVFTPEMLAQLQNLDPQQLKHFMQQLALQQQMRQRQRQMQQRQQQLQTGAMQQEVQAPAPGVGTQNMSLFWNGAIYR